MKKNSATNTHQNTILSQLESTLIERKTANPESSYVASLYQKGLNQILEKIGEEATETILAAKDHAATPNNAATRTELTKEVADLWFHCMVLLSHIDVPLADVLQELEQRMGISGHVEKAQRNSLSRSS